MSWFFLLSSTDEIRSFLCCCRSNGMSQVCLALIGSCSRCAPHLVAWPAKNSLWDIISFCFVFPHVQKMENVNGEGDKMITTPFLHAIDNSPPIFGRWLPLFKCSKPADCKQPSSPGSLADTRCWRVDFFPLLSDDYLTNKKDWTVRTAPRLLNHSVHVISYLKTPG